MKKYCLLLIIMMLSLNVKAITLEKCTTEKMNRLKEIADKIEFNYTYKMKEEKSGYKYPEFTITGYNLNDDIKALIIQDFYSMNYKEFKNNKGTGSLKDFREGENVTITLKAYTADECSTRTVAVKQVKLPYYNHYYEEDFCLTNPNFKYCKEFTDIELTQEKYNSEKEKYLKEEAEKNKVVEYSDNNKMLIIGIAIGAVIIAGGIVTYIMIRRKKNEL